jgi:FtsP/CotA-like multicopper oxidase with cupredoxin domain
VTAVLAALGCRDPDPRPPGVVQWSPPDLGDTAADRPILTSPREAEDLDPRPGVVHIELVAAPATFDVGGVAVDGWAYNGRVPGPTVRARRGDTVVVDFHNDLPDPTTIHWHGVGVPAAMDGAGWPMPEIPPGGSFTYTFDVADAGTFWYHPHLDTDHQVDAGLYGVVVVEDPGDPAVDQELVAVLDTFGGSAGTDPHVVDASARWAVNGLVDPLYPAAGTVRVRLVNVSNAGYVDLRDVVVIARDQGLLAAPDDRLVLAPGDRAELAWQVGAGFVVEGSPYSVAGGTAFGDPVPLLEVVGGGPTPDPVDWPFVSALPSADPGTTDLRFTMTGSTELGWELNGETFPHVTVPALALGSVAILELRNVSPSNHPFHVHGHTFEVLSVDGVAPAVRTIEDTIDVPIDGVVRLRLSADNPGTWMAHCHVLPHAEGGMMTMIEVR